LKIAGLNTWKIEREDPIFKQYSLPKGEVGYPGGIFNPLNFAPTLEAKEKEIANGRLAMLAFLGFIIQPFRPMARHHCSNTEWRQLKCLLYPMT